MGHYRKSKAKYYPDNHSNQQLNTGHEESHQQKQNKTLKKHKEINNLHCISNNLCCS